MKYECLIMPYEEMVQYVLQNHSQAIAFYNALANVAHVWDDLIDQDKDVESSRIHFAFETLLSLNANPFYRDHFDFINPVINLAVIEWHAANLLEQSEDLNDKQIAFITRSSYAQILIVCAMIIGGKGWAVEVTPLIRRTVHAEGFNEYMRNLAHEKAVRNVRNVNKMEMQDG